MTAAGNRSALLWSGVALALWVASIVAEVFGFHYAWTAVVVPLGAPPVSPGVVLLAIVAARILGPVAAPPTAEAKKRAVAEPWLTTAQPLGRLLAAAWLATLTWLVAA